MISYALRAALALLLLLGTLSSTPVRAADSKLTPEQEARFQKFLPKTFVKLQRRAPVHAVTIGDSVMVNYGYSPEYGNLLKAWPSVFLQQLADQFYYPGGVRVLRPQGGHPAKLHEIIGEEITVQSLARGGKLMFHAAPSLLATGFENKPDIVLLSFGINDSSANCDLSFYRRALQDVIDLVKAQGADILLFSPTLTVQDPPEQGLAATRPYAAAMKEVAEANGVYFADLGDLSWLVTLDDRNKEIEKKKKAPKDAPPVDPNAPPPAPPLIKNPIADQLDTDPEKKAANLFDHVVQDYRKYFNHGSNVDWVHPDMNFQRVLGRRAFTELLNGPKTLAWKVSGGTAVQSGADQLVLTARVENTSDKEQTFTMLPLVTGFWRPQAAPTEVFLKPGKGADVNVTYVRTANRAGTLPAADAAVRLPILFASKDQARIEDVAGVISPVAVIWHPGSTANAQDGAEIQASIVNTTNKPVQGKWEASWVNGKWSGEVNIPPGGDALAKMNIQFPADDNATRERGRLVFTFTSGGATTSFDRDLEILRNVGLKQGVPLTSQGDYPAGKLYTPVMPSASNPGVVFRADADVNALYLTWEIYGINLQDAPGAAGAVGAEVNLDARSYGKRLLPGTTEAFRGNTAAADGDGAMGPIYPWCFGTGYAMYYNEKLVKCRLTSKPDGSRRLTMTLPRNYLYLHEWKISNGNSQVGISTTLYAWQGDAGSGAPGYMTFGMVSSAFHRDDAQGLVTLELTDKPTKRWTVRLY